MNDKSFHAANGRRLTAIAIAFVVGLVGSASAQEAPFLTLNGISETITVRDFNSGANDDTTFNPTGGSAPTQTTAGGISSYQYPGAIVNDPKLLFDDGGGTYNQLRYNWVRARYRQSAASGINVWERVAGLGEATALGAATVNFAEGTGDPSNPSPTGAGYRLDPFVDAPANGVFEIDYLVSDRIRTFGLGEWDRGGDANGWTTSNIAGPTIAGSQYSGTSASTSPQLDSPQFNANQHGLVEIRMQRNGTGTAGLSWAQAGAFSGTQRFEFTPVDTGSNTYMIDLSKQPSWTGADMQLRLEPTNESGQAFAVDYVRARAEPKAVWRDSGGTRVWDGNPNNQMWFGEQGAVAGGGALTGWINTPYDDAIFNGSGGTVTTGGSGGGPQVNDISFQTDGYVVQGFPLRLDGARPQIEVTGVNTATINSVIRGDQGLEKTGAGTLALNAANEYTGPTSIAAGTLRLGAIGRVNPLAIADHSFENVTFTSPPDNSSVWSYRPVNAVDWSFSGNSGASADAGPWYDGSAPDGTQAGFIQGGGSSFQQTISVAEAGVYSIAFQARGRGGANGPNGVIVEIDGTPVGTWAGADVSQGGFTDFLTTAGLSAGAHTLTFRGNNTIGGDKALAIDIVEVYQESGGLPETTALTLSGPTAILDLNGTRQRVGSLAGVAGSSIVGGSLIAGGNNASTTFAGSMAGAGVLIKEGSGTLTMTGGNTFSGGLLVNGGTLINNGSMPNAPVTVAAGATLGGTGTYGDLTISGIISPGNSVGTMFAGDTTWSDGSSFLFEIDNATGVAGGPGGWDLLNLGGDTLTLSGLTAGGFEIDVDTLLSGGGTVSGDMDNFVDADVYDWEFVRAGSIVDFDAGDFTFDVTGFTNAYDPAGVFSITQQGSSLYVTYTSPFTSVPEPGTWALFGLLLIGGICYQRKRQLG